LSDSGFEVLIAQDGESAIERVDYAHPDIILLDVLMPGIDGFETCRQLKANPSTQDIPIIFMTALSDTVDKVRGFELGAVDYITKPIQHEEVLARVRTHLTIRKLTQQLQQQNACLKQEIIERQQAQEALQQSEQRLQMLAKNVPGMLYEFLLGSDGSMAFPYISPGCHQIYELEPEVIQENATVIIELIHPDQREYFEQSVAISAQTLQPWNWEGQIILPSGKNKWIRRSGQAAPFEFTCEYNTPKTPNRIATCLDEKLVRHIIGNLLSNAIKYSPEGSTVKLSLCCSPKEATFTIQDQGIGIPESDQKRLFETFHRAANVGNIEGTGLGLAIVKNSVDAHGGTITLSSEVDVGTRFTVTLPLISL
jgi:signal transduction histidine kinase